MSLLSKSTYNRLSKYSDKAFVILANPKGELVETGALINLVQHKSKVSTRWETTDSENVYPLTYAALIINGKIATVSNIRPIERTEFGYLDLDYEWRDA